MAKNKKFKKRFKSEIISQLNQSKSAKQKDTQLVTDASASDKSTININPQEQEISQITSTDLKKILTIFGCLAVILVALYFIGQKTNYLTTFADYLTKILNLN